MSSFQSNSASNYREEIPEFEVILNKIENILRTEEPCIKEAEEGAEPAEQKDDPIDYDESMMSTHCDIDAYQEYLQCIEECNANDTTADQVVPMTFEEWQVMNYDASYEEAEDEYEDEESRKEEEYYEECRKEEAFEVYKQGKIDDMFRGRRR
jgi:hypothetical protein